MREQREIEVEVARRDLRLVAVALELEAPVVDPHAGAVELGVREREAGARRALVVQQAAALRIGQRGVREQDLSRVELLGLSLASSGRARKNVIWKPSGPRRSQPVTYHHSTRNSGCAP